MSGKREAELGWLARRMVGGALAGLHGRLAEQAGETARLHQAMVDLAAEVAALRAAVALQSLDIERLRVEALTLERRLDGETSERSTLGQALFERIESARR